MRTKLFLYYLGVTFVAASLCHLLLQIIAGHPVFASLGRMPPYNHNRHPYQYIGLACMVFAVVAAVITPFLAGTSGWKRVILAGVVMLGSVVIASAPGGVLWGFHNVQIGFYPAGLGFWSVVEWGVDFGLRCGWLVIALSFPYNAIGLFVGYFIMARGIRLAAKARQ